MTHQTSTVCNQASDERSNWQQWAACGGDDPESFYGDDSRHAGRPQPWEQDAIRICQRCPVRAACLDEAVMWPESAQHSPQHGPRRATPA